MDDIFSDNQLIFTPGDESLKGQEAVRDLLTTILFRPEEINLEILTALELNGIFLGNGMFCVVCYSINGIRERSAPRSPSEHEAQLSRRSLYMALETIVQQETAFACVNYTLRVADVVVCIACFPRQYTDNGYTLRLLGSVAMSIHSKFQEQCGYSVVAAISPLQGGLESISGLFQQTREMLDFSTFLGMEPPVLQIPDDTIRDTKIDRDFSLFSSFAGQIRRAIQAKDLEQVKQTHCYAMEYISGTGIAGKSQFLTRVSNYMCMVFQHLLDVGILTAQLAQEMDFLTRIAQQPSRSALMSDTEQLLVRVYESASSTTAGNMDIRIADIKDFVESNISDPSLSAQLIAEKFQMSQATLSLCFKRSCSQNVSDYIRTQRLVCAQNLIQTSALPLSEICRLSGFCSTTTMYRTFKKYLHMTPGEYKASVKQSWPQLSDNTNETV